MLISIASFVPVPVLVRYLREAPLLWAAAGCLLAAIGLVLISTAPPERRFKILRNIAILAALLVLLPYLALALYSLHCFMLQTDEANILSIAAASLRGLPMYQPPANPDASVSLMYGPAVFLIYRTALLLGGVDHFWILRAAIVAANLGLCAGLYRILRKFISTSAAIVLLAFPVSILLQHAEICFGMRSDIWIILCTTLAILSSFLETELLAILLTGILCGILVNLKISAAPAALFPLLTLYRRFGLRALAISVPTTIAFAFAPFALPNVSLHNYLLWIRFTRSEGISPLLFWLNFGFALFLLTPCLLLDLFVRRFGLTSRQRLPELALIVLGLLLAVSTSKPGSGPWYFWHIVPSVVVYLALAVKQAKDLPLAQRAIPLYFIAIALAVLTWVNLPRAAHAVRAYAITPAVGIAQQSIDRYLHLYRDRTSIQMGYGSDANAVSTDLRYILVYRGQPYTLEGNTGRFETLLVPVPANVLHRMQTCKDDVWLLPHAQKPFDLFVFPDALRATFLQNYAIDQTDPTYDAWVCNRARNQ